MGTRSTARSSSSMARQASIVYNYPNAESSAWIQRNRVYDSLRFVSYITLHGTVRDRWSPAVR